MPSVDVLVVGSGPSGLTAASRLARRGARVVVLEREDEPGGVPRHCDNPSFGLRELKWPHSGPEFARKLADRAASSGVDIQTETTVTDLEPGDNPSVKATSPGGRQTWTAKAVVLATGARERPRHARRISGSRAPGVFTTGELQQFTHLGDRRIGERALVYGAEHVSFSALMTLRKAGIDPVAIVTSQPRHQTFGAFRMLATRFRTVPLFTNHTIASIEGKERVSGVWLYYPGWGAWPGSDEQVIDVTNLHTRHRRQSFIECDTVIVSGDWVSEGDLAVRSGLTSDVSIGGRPDVSRSGTTDRNGVFAAGALIHPGESAGSATNSGKRVAKAIHSFLHEDQDAQKRIPVKAIGPGFRWIWPNWVEAGRPVDMTFRVDIWLERVSVRVHQDGRILDSIRFRRTEPGRTYGLPAHWLRSITSNAGIELEIKAE